MAGRQARKESQLARSVGRVQTTSKGEERTRRKAVDARPGGAKMVEGFDGDDEGACDAKKNALTCGGGPPGYAWYCCCPG